MFPLTLCLKIFLHGLEPDISQPSWDQTLEEFGALNANELLLP